MCRFVWRGTRFDVAPGESAIGRDRGAQVHVEADSVSRRHARVMVTPREVSIEDLDSKNGTWVGGSGIDTQCRSPTERHLASARRHPIRDRFRRSTPTVTAAAGDE
jgi:pSer/pThr/pTyr-binding forkhead associated (FHA) protein